MALVSEASYTYVL